MLLASDLSDRCKLSQTNDATIFGRNLAADTSRIHQADGFHALIRTGPGIQVGGYGTLSDYSSPPPADVRIEVDADKIEGSDKTLFGIMCRFNLPRGNTASTAYTFTIATDGTYVVDFVGSPTVPNRTLASGKAASPPSGVRRIRADRIGPSLTLYVNGQRIAAAQDSALSNGIAGIYMRSEDAAGGQVLFKNFVVAKP